MSRERSAVAESPGLPSLALTGAGLLLLARSAILLAHDRSMGGAVAERAVARLGLALPREALFALAFAVVWALLARSAQRRGGVFGRLSIVPIAALLGAYGLGTFHADPSRSLDPAAFGPVWGLALVAALLGVALLAQLLLATGRCVGRRSAAFALGILVFVPLGMRSLEVRSSPDMVIEQVIAELTLDAEWEAVEEHPNHPVKVTMLTTSRDWRRQGGERPALEMVPPAEVRMRLPEVGGECRLHLSAGVHANVWRRLGRLPEEQRSLSFRFEVLLDGEPVFDRSVTVDHSDPRTGTDWVPIDPEGLRVRGGEELVLRTHVPEERGPWLRPVLPLEIGFGDLRLVHERVVPRAEATPERPNIVFIVMDTLRADRTSAYGYARETTPHLDALAERGTLFERAQSAGSYTWPATGSLLTGLLPEAHGVLDGDSCYLAQSFETLAEALQKSGYTTAAFTGNPLIVPGKGFGQGFEFFDFSDEFRKSPEFVPNALAWLELFADRRFFAYFQLVDPHGPLEPTAEAAGLFAQDADDSLANALDAYRQELFRGAGRDESGRLNLDEVVQAEERRELSDLYDAAVYDGDAWLGRIIESLDRLGLTENTVVVFTSDHGEELFDHGHGGHGQSLYQELIHVPLVVAGPGVPAGARVTAPQSTRHLAPTLAAVGGGALDVEDRVDLLAPGEGSETIYFSTHSGWWNGWHRTPLFGARAGDLVLHWAPKAGEWGGEEPAPPQWSLFDLSGDPTEERDLSPEQAQTAEELRAWLEARRRELEQRRGSRGIGASSSTRELLRRIGYEGD